MENNKIAPRQASLPFTVAKHAEIEGLQMGVLTNGTPYLTMRGLARLCGVHHTMIQRLAGDWESEKLKPRGFRIMELLKSQGFNRTLLHLEVMEGNIKVHAITDDVCMAILEYYAFDSTQGSNEVALTNYRILARQTLRTFIYTKVGFDPDNRIPESWKQFRDRVKLSDLPKGYYNVFREIADIVVFAIQQGLEVDSQTIPDISVGQTWAKYWNKHEYDNKYGQRVKYPHEYPSYFPQARSNPQEIWVYPLSSLGEFRIWMQSEYLPQGFPKYLQKKVADGKLPASNVELLLDAIDSQPELT